MKRILIVTHFCSDFESKGNNRFNYLAKMLAQRGNQVEFMTSDFSHVKKKPRTAEAADPSFHVTLIHESGYPKNVCIARILSHREFGRNLRKALGKIEKPEVVYLAVPSLDAAVVTTQYCRKNGIKLIIDIQDLWPEAFSIALKRFGVPEWVFGSMKRQADYVYRNADEVVAVSQTYLDRANRVRDNDEGHCVFIGTDLDVFDAYPEIHMDKPDGEQWIVYIGTLGSSYNIDIVIDAVRLLTERGVGGFRFKVFGDGPSMEQFKQHADGLPVDFYGRVLYKDLIGYVRNCDIAVNPIIHGAAQSIINKHADYAAAGLPVVNTQECPEYRNLMEKWNCGINCDVDSAEQVANALQELITNPSKRISMGKNSRKMAEAVFDRKKSYREIVELIESEE